MKTSDEMASSALHRIREHEEVQKSRKKMLMRTAVPVMSVCIVALLGIGVWQSGLLKAKTDATDRNETAPGQITEEENLSPSNSVQKDTVVINKIDTVPADAMKANIGLFWDDFVKMDRAQLIEYYGCDVFPAVPEDLTNWDTEENFTGYGIYRRNGGTGEVYFDQTVINYSSDDFSRSVNVEIAKGKLPFICFVVDTQEYAKSVISGAEVYIGVSDAGYFTAQLMYDDIGYIFTMKGLSQDEAVAVVRSVVE